MTGISEFHKGQRVQIKPTGARGTVTGFIEAHHKKYVAIKLDCERHVWHWELPTKIVEPISSLVCLAECAE